MDKIFSSLQYPSKYKQLLQLENVVCGSIIEHFRILQSEKLDVWLNDSFQYLESQKLNKEPARFYRICFGISCLYLFFLDNISPLESSIVYLYKSNEDYLSMKFCAHTIAKVAGALPPAEDGFAQHQLDQAFHLIHKSSSNNNYILFGLYLLHDLAMSIPLLFLFHSADVPELIWPFLIDCSPKIREAASNVLSQYLIVLVKYQGFRLHETFDQIINNAISHLLKSPSDCPQGVLNIIEVVLKIKPDFFLSHVQSIYEAIHQILKNIDQIGSKNEAKTNAFRVIASISTISPSFFEQDTFTNLFISFTSNKEWPNLTPEAFEGLVKLIKNIPSLFKEPKLLKNIYGICLHASQKGQVKK